MTIIIIYGGNGKSAALHIVSLPRVTLILAHLNGSRPGFVQSNPHRDRKQAGPGLKAGPACFNNMWQPFCRRLFVAEGFYRIEAGGFCGGPHPENQTDER